MRYHYTTIEVAEIKGNEYIKCWWCYWGARTHTLMFGIQNGTTTLKKKSLVVS